ncbi:hypothetical protein [Trueperella sp.]|uniref:hypothetical protein n=1 Tax=Trueperella sp. TaxID=2699835 RepID=UPI0022EA5B19|nr:hypothetical protein [Trueperella sp.]
MSEGGDPASQVGKPVRRRGSRRVVMVSEVDAKRIAAGEFASAEEALHATDARQPGASCPRSAKTVAAEGGEQSERKTGERAPRQPKPDQQRRQATPRLSLHDQEILNEVPPHFGKF